MNANQIPYDQLDWLQLGIYFLALPIVAVGGALLGLMGRARRGGVLWSTNVGLLGGAVACLIVTLGISTLEGESFNNFLDDFLDHMRWKMLATTLAATACCAVVAAIAWRFLYPPREKQPFAFSIGGILLVQLFSLISMGCWIGLRLYMLERFDVEQIRVANEVPGWAVYDGGRRVAMPLQSASSADIRDLLSPTKLSEIAAIQALQSVEFQLDGNWKVDLSPLFAAKNLESVNVYCVNADEYTFKQLAAAKTKHLSLQGDFSNSNLEPLAESTSLEHLTIVGRVSRKSLESLAKSKTITGISHHSCELTNDKQAVQQWPRNLDSLNISVGPINKHDLAVLAKQGSLRWLYVDHVLEDDESISAIASMPKLEYLSLRLGQLNPESWKALGSVNVHQMRLHVVHPALSKSQLLPIIQLKSLVQLDLTKAKHGDDIVEALAAVESLQALSINSEAVSEAAMLALALHPRLTSLEYPKHLDTPSFHNAFERMREEANLPPIKYMSPIGAVRAQDLPPGAGSTTP